MGRALVQANSYNAMNKNVQQKEYTQIQILNALQVEFLTAYCVDDQYNSFFSWYYSQINNKIVNLLLVNEKYAIGK